MAPTRAVLVAVLALTGCTYVDSEAYQEALCKLDEDNDGDPRCGPSGTEADGDCNDKDPEMSNLRTESGATNDAGEVIGGAYDGKDNDCEGGDLLDVDGDGFAGISREDYEALGLDPWPSGQREELDCLDLPAAGFEEGYEQTVYPDAGEQWYDGVDGDCGFDNDFDQDGDQHATALAEHAADYAAYRATIGAEIDWPDDDCLDTDKNVHPGTTTPETFYDGTDQDCAGDNDFDPDGDGRLTTGYDGEAEIYKTRFKYVDMTWIPDADCMDVGDTFPAPEGDVSAALAQVTYSRVPGDDGCDASERSCEGTWYDGYDDSCDEVFAGSVLENDFDQDGDGYMRTADRAAFLAYVKRYLGFTDTLGRTPYFTAFRTKYGSTDQSVLAYFDNHDNDCNDTDAGVNPEALEGLGDGIDQDCDTGPDTAYMLFDQITWSDPGPPRMTLTDEHHVLVAAATDGVDVGQGFGLQSARVVAVSWALDASPDVRATVDATPYTVATDGNVLHAPVSVTSSGASYYVGTSWSAPPRTRLQYSRSDRNTTTFANYQLARINDSGSRTDQRTYTEGDLRCDSDTSTCWQVACDGDTLHFVEFDEASVLAPLTSGWDDSIDAVDCFVLPGEDNGGTPLIGAVLSDGSIAVYEEELGVLVPAGVNPFSTLDVDFARSHDEWLILGRSTGGLRAYQTGSVQETLLTGDDFVDADLVTVGSTFYVAGLRDDGSVVLAYGTTSGLTEVEIPLETPDDTLTATGVALSADADRVVLAVAGSDGQDRIGWTILQP